MFAQRCTALFHASRRAQPIAYPTASRMSPAGLLRGNEALCQELHDGPHKSHLFDIFAHALASPIELNEDEAGCGLNPRGRDARSLDAQRPEAHGLDPGASGRARSCPDQRPALDFFFIVCCPTPTRAMAPFQLRVGATLWGPAYESLREAAVSEPGFELFLNEGSRVFFHFFFFASVFYYEGQTCAFMKSVSALPQPKLWPMDQFHAISS